MTGALEARAELAIHPERCVHQRVRGAACRACVDACPTAAWQMSDDGLAFDPDACDACGLCVAACPTEALELPAPQPLLQRCEQMPPAAWWRCERAGLPGRPSTACLLALSPAWLHLASRRLGVHDHVFVPGACSRCERGAGLAEWQRQWRGQAALAASQGFALRLRLAPAADWPAAHDTGAPADASRRRFFARAATPAAPRVAGALNSAREDVWTDAPATSPAQPAPPLWRVDFERARCTLCLACTRVCPVNAIFFEAEGADSTATGFGFDLQRCTGCGLCSAVCEDGALSQPAAGQQPDAPPLDVPAHWPVVSRRCPHCRIDFRQFVESGDASNSVTTCPTCSQGRPFHADRIVQADSST